jgi:oligopeptide transport system substrate-binding protein
MKRMKRFLALSLAIGVVAVSVAGCSGDKKNNANESGKETTEAGASGDTLDIRVCVGSEPQTMDPALNKTSDGGMMAETLFEGLMSRQDDGNGRAKIVEGQAASYEVSEDKTVYTFHLRDDIQWSDGQPVVAEDFVYSWQRLVDPETASDYNYMIDMVANANEIMEGTADKETLGIKAVDDKTLEVTLTYACPFFLEVTAFSSTFPVRKDIVEADPTGWYREPSTYITNGPFKLEEWEHNSNIKVVKNDKYYGKDEIGPDSIDFVLMDNENSMLTAYNGGDLDFIMNMPVDEIPTLIEEGKITIVPKNSTYYVSLQVEKDPFTDPKVREAFSLAIDRNYIVDQITRSGQIPAGAFVPTGILDAAGLEGDDFRTVGGDYYSVKPEDYEANCEKARELLAEAGYPNGEGFPVVEYMYNTLDKHKVIGEALQNMWQTELGVQVTLNNQDWNVFVATRKSGDYEIARNGWSGDYNDPISFLDLNMSTNGNNDGKYANSEYDALVEKAKNTADTEERMKYIHEAEDIIMKDSGIIPIYFDTDKYMLNEELQGVFSSTEGHFYFKSITRK